MDDNQQSLLGTRKIHTETYKNQAYDLIKKCNSLQPFPR